MQVGAPLLTEDSRSFSRRPSVKIFPVANDHRGGDLPHPFSLFSKSWEKKKRLRVQPEVSPRPCEAHMFLPNALAEVYRQWRRHGI